MTDTLLGVDFGTGGAKATLIDDQGKVLAYAFREYTILHPRPGWSEVDADVYWKVFCEVVGEVLDAARGTAGTLRGIAVSSALPSLVVTDEVWRPLAPALNLLDRRAIEEVSIIRDLVGVEAIEQTTANRIEDHPILVNLFWYQRRRRDTYQRIHKALTVDGFLTARLSGRATVNLTSAVFYGVAYDIRAGAFDERILEKLGIEPAILPDVVAPTDVIGTVSTAAAGATGLPQDLPIMGGQVDCNAGWIAGGATTVGDVQLNLGTSGVLGILHDEAAFLSSDAGLSMLNVPYTPNPTEMFAAVAATTTGGQALRYLRDTIGGLEVDLSRQLGVSEYDLLTMQADKVPAGSDGLLVLPYLMGERSPIWDTSARAVIFGLSLHHGRGHLIRAFLEGVAFALYDSYSVLQSAGLPMNSPMVFNEGGAQSAVWRRIITDVFGIPTAMLKSRTGAPLGDALLAGVGVGVWNDFSIAKELAEYGDYLEPDPREHERYLEYFQLFKSVYAGLDQSFKQLQAITRR